jgi:hypothetical protein
LGEGRVRGDIKALSIVTPCSLLQGGSFYISKSSKMDRIFNTFKKTL